MVTPDSRRLVSAHCAVVSASIFVRVGVFANRGIARYLQCFVRIGVCFKGFASTVPVRDVEHRPVRDIRQWCEMAGPPMAAAGQWSLLHAARPAV